MVTNGSASDSEAGMRSLICDATGIVIGEMTYRCIKCPKIFDMIADLHRHYRTQHGPLTPNPARPHKNNGTLNGTARQSPQVHVFKKPRVNQSPVHLKRKSVEDEQDSELALSSHDEDQMLSNDTAIKSESDSETDLETNQELLSKMLSSDSALGNSIKAHLQLINSVADQPQKKTVGGGLITCEVCGLTKFYSHLARRFGIFSCEGCAKFFRRYLTNPKSFACNEGGNCDLNVAGIQRCKSCLLRECLKKYKFDVTKYPALEAMRNGETSGSYQLSESLDDQLIDSTDLNGTSDSAPKDAQSSKLSRPVNGVNGDSQNNGDEDNLGDLDDFDDLDEYPCPVDPQQQLQEGDDELDFEDYTDVYQESDNTPTSSHKNSSQSSSGDTSQGNFQYQLQRSLAERGLLFDQNMLALATSATNGSGGSRRNRHSAGNSRKGGCKQCPGCLAEDCGVCIYCLDKPKFGGNYTKKQRCINRRCNVPRP